MNKPLLLAAVLLAAPLALRADDEEAPASAAPDAAASSTKGYKTDEAPQAATTGGDSAPIETRSDPRVISAPAQRPLGGERGSSRAASPGTGSGGAAADGISCEKSVPPLTGGVVRKELDMVETGTGRVSQWEVPPNGAISYKFKSPSAGGGGFVTEMGTNARPVPHLTTISRTPCDFDVDKALTTANGGSKAKSTLCYAWAPVAGGVIFTVGGKGAGCSLKPDQTYYFNIRSLTNPAQGAARDACADEIPFFRAHRELRAACGGIWKLMGNFTRETKPAK